MEQRFVKLGSSEVDLSTLVRDLRGVEDIVAEAIDDDWQENRYLQFDQRLYPFSEAADIAEWDSFLLNAYHPLYTDPQTACPDCPLGPCQLDQGPGRCGLGLLAYQARLSLRACCRGTLGQMVITRELLDYAVKLFGRDKPISWGQLHDVADTSHVGMFTGLRLRTTADLERAQTYAEEQLTKAFLASYSGTGTLELEQMALHAGSMLIVTMDIAELVKMNCFGFTNASDHDMRELINWPPVTVQGGLGSVEADKPVLAFVGDDFLPAWVAINRLKEAGLENQVEVGGIGTVGHDIVRFYDKCRILGPMPKARKVIRSGVADVIVASTSCLNYDFVADASKVQSRLIWTAREKNIGLPDRIDDPIDDIVKDLLSDAPGAWIRDVEKAGEVAVKVVQGVKRKGNYTLSETAIKAEARKCREDCDLCFSVCPNSLLLGQAVRRTVRDGIGALAEVEKGCYLCGRCQAVCPEKIDLEGLIVTAQEQRRSQDKFRMRAGRGTIPRVETTAWAFAAMWGNSPGMFHLLGCGDAKYQEDIGWIANELVSRNCAVYVGGCGAGEVARHYDEASGKFVFEQFGAENQIRNLINHGGCSSCAHILDMQVKWPRTGGGISHYANFAETIDCYFNLMFGVCIVWGTLPERMYAMVTAWARSGLPVIVGPASAFAWKRFLTGNKWDWQRWWVYESFSRKKRITEPGPKHMIIPVETIEEAIALGMALINRPADPRDGRGIRLETYMELYKDAFGEWPDDWHLFVRSDWELPLKFKGFMLKELQEKHGWEVRRLKATKAKHPDGRLLDMGEFLSEFSAMGVHQTKLPRFFGHDAKTFRKKGAKE